MGKIYQYHKLINTYETTSDSRMSPVAPLEYFQESAQRQLDTLGLGLEFMAQKHLAWILVKYEIEFLSYPTGEEKVIIETEPLGFNRFEAYRRFAVLSEDGEPIVKGKSIWMLANTETGRLVRVTDVKELEELIDPDGEVYKIARLEKITEYDHETEFKVRYLDIDINHHVNNVKYLGWAIESLPLDIVRDYEIKELRIIYKAQAFYGETVIAKTARLDSDKWRIDICKEDGSILCEIEIIGRLRENRLSIREHE